MYFKGCPHALGCTILLKGCPLQQLRRVKKVARVTMAPSSSTPLTFTCGACTS